MLLLLSTLILATIILLVIYWHVLKFKYDRLLCNFKGPKPIPLFGNALDFRDSAMILKKLLAYSKTYGSFRVIIGFRPGIVVCDYNLVEFFMNTNTHLAKSMPYKMLQNWLGTGLLTGDGEKWKKHRKILTPAFHFKILETFLPLFDNASNILVDKLQEIVDDKDVDIYPYITKLTLDLICESAMGITVNAQINPNTKYIDAVKEICQIIVDRTFSAFKSINSIYILTPTYQAERKCVKYLQNTTTAVIKQRRKVLEEESVRGIEVNEDEDNLLAIGAKKKFMFLDVLLKARVDGESLSDADIREEVNTFLFAGHDTTASGISFILYALANHPEVQSRVVDELREIFGDDKNHIATYQDLQDMKYLEMVIKESLRLYPPVPAIGREQPYDLEYDGHIIPANTGCILFLYGIHRNPDYFPDPEKFDPNRFAHNNKMEKSQFSFIPFSAGSRNCIGQKFAMLEMKATIAKILRNYKLLPGTDHKLNLVLEITLKSSTGIKISLKRRKW